MCFGIFSLDGEVVFIYSKHVNKICSITLILVSTCGYLKDYLRGVIYFVNPKFGPYDCNSKCTRTEKKNPSYLRLTLGRLPFGLKTYFLKIIQARTSQQKKNNLAIVQLHSNNGYKIYFVFPPS